MPLPTIRQRTWVAVFVLLLACLILVLAIARTLESDGPPTGAFAPVTDDVTVELVGPRLPPDGTATPGTAVRSDDRTVPAPGTPTVVVVLPTGCHDCGSQLDSLPDLPDGTAGTVVARTAPGALPAGWQWLPDDTFSRAATHLGATDTIHWALFDRDGALVGTTSGPQATRRVSEMATSVTTDPAPPLPTR